MLIVHYAVKTDLSAEAATSVGLERKILDPVEPIPPGAIWIDMVEPTVDEDQKVERYLGAKVPSRSDPDFAQPSESYYAENGVRYLHACVVSEAENTPDVAEVTFILGPKALVTVRYDPGEAFELFGQRLGENPGASAAPRRGGGRSYQRHRRSLRPGVEQGRRRARIPSRARSFEPRATKARAARSIPRPSARSAARTRRSRTCAKAWSSSSGSCCS